MEGLGIDRDARFPNGFARRGGTSSRLGQRALRLGRGVKRPILVRGAGVVLAAITVYCAAAEILLPRDEPLLGAYDAVVVLGAGVLPDSNLNEDGAMRL